MVQPIKPKICPFMSNAVPAMHKSPIAAPGTPAQQVTMRVVVPCAGPECAVFDERIGDCGAKGQWIVLASILTAILEAVGGKLPTEETEPETSSEGPKLTLVESPEAENEKTNRGSTAVDSEKEEK